MRRYLAGLLTGIVLTAGATLVWDVVNDEPAAESPPVAETRSGEPAAAPDADSTEEPPPSASMERPSRRRRIDDGAPRKFAKGTFTLLVGEGYVFGERRARPNPSRDEVDLLCIDVRRVVTLVAPVGAANVLPPKLLSGELLSNRATFDLLTHAPETLEPQSSIGLASTSTPAASGVIVVRDRRGSTHKLMVESIEWDDDVRERAVHVRYETIPTAAGGGRIDIPGKTLGDVVDAERTALVTSFPRLPEMSFTDFGEGTYRTFEGTLPDELDLDHELYLLLEQPLTSEITLKRRGAVYAEQGITAGGRVVLDSYSAAVIDGDMAGRIDVKSYAFVRIRGNVSGTLNIDSYATVILEGDVLGKIVVDSYTTLYHLGTIHRPAEGLEQDGSCWSTFYFDRYMSRARLEQFKAGRSVTLHVRSSDLAVGEHEGVGEWRKVVVGGEVWTTLDRDKR